VTVRGMTYVNQHQTSFGVVRCILSYESKGASYSSGVNVLTKR